MTDKTNVFAALIKAQPHFLDRPLADLLPMRFMGEVAVHAYQGLIKRLDNLPLSLEEKESRLKDGQDAGRALLAIEAKIGELLPLVETTRKMPRRKGDHILPKEMGFRQAYHARAIAAHPREVEEVIKEAEANEDIPTKTAVLNKIAYKRELERVKGKREATNLEMAADAFGYYIKLQEALSIIPVKPPKEIREKDLLKIKALALLIIKRLEVFNNGSKSKILSESV